MCALTSAFSLYSTEAVRILRPIQQTYNQIITVWYDVNKLRTVAFEVLIAVVMKNSILWGVTLSIPLKIDVSEATHSCELQLISTYISEDRNLQSEIFFSGFNYVYIEVTLTDTHDEGSSLLRSNSALSARPY
jgi:hypothetical protein